MSIATLDRPATSTATTATPLQALPPTALFEPDLWFDGTCAQAPRHDAHGRRLTASDSPAGMPFQRMQGVFVSLADAKVARGGTVFDTLAERGQVVTPIAPCLRAAGFGRVGDRSGTSWMVNAEPGMPGEGR